MYVDDILAISCDAKAISQDVQRTFELKNDRIDTSEFYLRAKLQEKPTNGLKCWTMTSRDYVNAAVENIEETLRGTRRQLPTSNADTLMKNTYGKYYRLTGWERCHLLSRVNGRVSMGYCDRSSYILLEVALLSRYYASPRECHLEQLLRIFALLRHQPSWLCICLPNCPVRTSVSLGQTEMISCRRIEMWMNGYHTRCPYHEDRVWFWQSLLMRHMPQISRCDNHIQDTNSWIEHQSIVWSSTRQVTVEKAHFQLSLSLW